jgi:hypothetical protein
MNHLTDNFGAIKELEVILDQYIGTYFKDGTAKRRATKAILQLITPSEHKCPKGHCLCNNPVTCIGHHYTDCVKGTNTTDPVALNGIDDLEEQLHKIYGFCNEDGCTAKCKPTMRRGMKLIKAHVATKEAEAYDKGLVDGANINMHRVLANLKGNR